MKGSAWISDCGTYRFALVRSWDRTLATLIVVMLNPSTADAYKDDATIRKVIKFAKAHGYGGILVLNLFALRATDPAELKKHPSPHGRPTNDEVIERFTEGQDVLCAWGTHGALGGTGRRIAARIAVVAKKVMCLKTTKDGHPGHPLYIKDSQRFKEFRYD